MLPFLDHSGFVHSRYDKAEVFNDRFLASVQCTPALFLVVAPRGEKFGGKMVVRIACHFSDKG